MAITIPVSGMDTSDANAQASDILSGKTAYVDGDKITGTIPSKAAQTYTPGTSSQTIAAGQYLSGAQTISGSSNLVAANIKTGKSIFGVAGTFTADANATASQILSGKTAYVNGSKVTGNISSKSAQTYTPTTSDQTISSGQYLSGAQTIKGDANLVAANIKSGKTIFGVAGSSSVVDTSDADAAAAEILSGKTAYVNGSKVTGSISSKAAATYNVSTSDQTIAAGQYLSGAQTIRAVTTSNLTASNIKKGVNVKVGDAGSSGRIKNLTGTAPQTTVDGVAATKDLTLTSYIIMSMAPHPFRYVGGAVVGDLIFFYGGLTDDEGSSMTYTHCRRSMFFDGANWKSRDSLVGNYYLYGCQTVVALDGKAYLCCARRLTNNELESDYLLVKLDFAGSSTTALGNMPVTGFGISLVYNNEIHFLKGTSHYKWNGSSWTSVSTIPVSVGSDNRAVVFNSAIHLVVGTSPSTHYKWNGSSWTTASTLPTPYSGANWYRCGLVVYNGNLHLMGGTGGAATHYVWNGSSWKYVGMLPNSNTYDGTFIVYKDDIYLIGGGMTGDEGSVVYTYRDAWRYLGRLPDDASPFSVLLFGSNITIVGDAKVHALVNGKWTEYTTTPVNFGHGRVVLDDTVNLHVMGGYNSYLKHYRCNRSTKAWTSVGDLPYNFYHGGLLNYTNTLVLLGGSYSNTGTKFYKCTNLTGTVTWTSLGTLPYDFKYGCVSAETTTASLSSFHIIGGVNNETKHYRWNGSSWTSVSTCPVRMAYGYARAVYTYGKSVYIHVFSSTDKSHYMWDGSSWTLIGTLPDDFTSNSMVQQNGQNGPIYLLCGTNRTMYAKGWTPYLKPALLEG